MIRYKIINADDEIIGYITANSIEYASAKLKFRYGDNACFLRLERES